MNASEISTDGSVLVRALSAPDHGFGRVTERRRVGLALAIATAASLLTAVVVIPRVDFGAAALAGGRTPEDAERTEGQREEAAVTARKLGQIAGWAGAALLPSALAIAAAGGLFAGFRVAGTRPELKPTLAVTAHGMLPVWLGGLLAIPPAIAHAPVPPEDVPRLVPSSLAALLPAGAAPPLVAALSSLDLFTLWALALVVVGMSRASGASRTRSLVVTLILFAAYVALLKVVPAALAGGAGPGPGSRGGP
jgi:hypothetical protein